MLVDEAKTAFTSGDLAKGGELMNKNQAYLSELGVSIKKLNAMISGALNAGAYGAKLSGAGGGDCMIALSSEEKRQAVIDGINSIGEVINVKTNAEGVRIEV
jgi:mevalonate kinase